MARATSTIEHLQAAQAELLRIFDEAERRAWSLSREIDLKLRVVRGYLEHQPIDQVDNALTALLEAEEKIRQLRAVVDGKG
jgi:hypothetical protein